MVVDFSLVLSVVVVVVVVDGIYASARRCYRRLTLQIIAAGRTTTVSAASSLG